MSKTFKRSRNDWDDFEDDEYFSNEEIKQKRKEKRLRSAIRSKDIEALMNMDDE